MFLKVRSSRKHATDLETFICYIEYSTKIMRVIETWLEKSDVFSIFLVQRYLYIAQTESGGSAMEASYFTSKIITT